MCTEASRVAQRKYNASEHGKEVRKAYREKKTEKSGGGEAVKYQFEKIGNNGLPQLTGTDKQTAWASDLRSRWINEQNEAIQSWGDVMPSLAEARAKASAEAAKKGITYRDGEGSAVYNQTIETYMKSKGFNGTANDFANAWSDYSSGSSINSTFPVPIQRKALKALGYSKPPKTKDVKERVSLYQTAAQMYAQSEKKASRWIELRNTETRRIVYQGGGFVPME